MVNIRRPREIPELSDSDRCRWWGKVWISVETDCWLWCGVKTLGGYGQFRLWGFAAKFMAHRVSFRMFRGKIPGGKVLMHRCDNPSCVNPRHLEVGSYQGNIWDMIRKGRHSGCVKVTNECPF